MYCLNLPMKLDIATSLEDIGAVRKIHDVGRKCSMHYLNLRVTAKRITNFIHKYLIFKINRSLELTFTRKS